MNRKVNIVLLVTLLMAIGTIDLMAAEGGYSNYIPGTYGDFAAAVEPPTKLTIRNDYLISWALHFIGAAQEKAT